MIKVSVEEIKITLTESAIKQLHLIIDNDFTLSDLVFRLQISGKGCTGFEYSLGFTESEKDDLIFKTSGLNISIDPFTAFYAKEGTIDYLFDEKGDEEGFIFTNLNQKNYKGKFFKDESTLPL